MKQFTFFALFVLFLQGVLSEGDAVNAFPVFKATLIPDQTAQSWSANCFLQNSGFVNVTQFGGVIHIEAKQKTDRTCTDLYLIANEDDFFIHEVATEGTHRIPIEGWQDGELEDVIYFGYQVFIITDGMIGEIEDLYAMYEYFDPKNNNTEAMIIDFLYENAGWNFTLRPEGQVFIPDPKDIKSGDYIAISDMDIGVCMLIMYGTGGKTSHTAVAIWRDDVLFVCESCDQGIMCTPYSEYMSVGHSGIHENSARLISIARLAPEYLERFDEKKAWEWYDTVNGLPYGYQNFLFGWIDTAYDNYPPPLSEELVQVAAPLIEKINPEWAILYNEAFNIRMGTENLSTEEILCLLEERNMTFTELMTIVEEDSFVYPSIPGPGRAMVCDVFVLALYKAAGVFGDMADSFQAAEFTPKDSYQLQIFDNEWEMPEGCPRERGYPYCQVNGKYYQDLDGFNSIEVYEHMNEYCGAMPKDYTRGPQGC